MSSLTVSLSLLCFIFSAVLFTLLLHVIAYGLLFRERRPKSPQFFLIKLIIAMNLPLLAGVWIISHCERRAFDETVFMFLFAFLVLNSLLYAYFHFFNMSETARRVRILLQIKSQGVVGLEELKAIYSPADIVSFRLQRLVEMGQITKGSDNKYRISSHFFLRIARMMHGCRRLLGLKSESKEVNHV